MNPEIILGPPGTGKTRSLLEEVETELAANTPPERIGYVSFTRRAADEAITRACEKFKFERARLPHFRTLHSLCFRQLGLRSGDVFEGRAVQEFAARIGVRITGRWSEDGTLSGFDVGDRVLFMENLSRIRCIALREQYDADDDNLSWTEVSRVSRSLAEFKVAEGLLDYTDMLRRFVEDQSSPPLDVLVVDESQDLSALQWLVVEKLARGARRVLVAGDDDQAIYRWAGADADHLIHMDGRSRVLGHSWRVPAAIQAVASRVLSVVHNRREKLWTPRDAVGSVDRHRSISQVDTDGEEILILARNAYIVREQILPELRRRGVVYELHGHSSVKPVTLAAVTAWERLRAGGAVTGAEARSIYDTMTSGVGVTRGHKSLKNFGDEDMVTMTDLRERGGLLVDSIWHDALDRIPIGERSYILAARRRGEKLRSKPRVRVSTIHGSKGGEADHVIVMKEMASRTHREMTTGGQHAAEDEARVWYVGVTRTRERLSIVESSTAQRCPWL